MQVLTMRITLRASWAHSLKEKRMVIKSLIQRLKNKFNVSVAEIDTQDIHQTIVVGIAAVCASAAQGDSIMEHILSFVEENTDAEIVDVQSETILCTND